MLLVLFIVGQSETLMDLSCRVSNFTLAMNSSKLVNITNAKGMSNFLEISNYQFSVDLSESFNIVDGVGEALYLRDR